MPVSKSIKFDRSRSFRNTQEVPAKSGARIGPLDLSRRTSRQYKRLFLCVKTHHRVMVEGLGSACAGRFLLSGRSNLNPLPPHDWTRGVAGKKPLHQQESPVMEIVKSCTPAGNPALCIIKSNQFIPFIKFIQHPELHQLSPDCLKSLYKHFTRLGEDECLSVIIQGQSAQCWIFKRVPKINPSDIEQGGES